MKKLFWLLWIVITLTIGGFYGYTLLVDEHKEELLIGDATHGHFQIELACTACHTDAFGGEEVLQQACVDCHQDELDQGHDSHPRKKFTDPRNADRLEVIDARYCVSCHTEHQQEQTQSMGVTLPDDYCYHCHQDVGEDRPSHKDLPFDSCASAGCHNYHDNRALYESFLVDNAGDVWLKDIARIAHADTARHHAEDPVTQADSGKASTHTTIEQQWLASAHAQGGVNCSGCHNDSATQQWIEKPGIEQCQDCHQQETEGFQQGKHGMRLAQGLTAMTPAQSEMAFKQGRANDEHSCVACHGAHEFNTQQAATSACLSCHNDQHSLAFEASPHAQLAGTVDSEAEVTCATCHMPRLTHKRSGEQLTRVEHNQNWNLRPNEKMIRSVCMNCHNLEFSIDALADELLIENNFNGKPAHHVPSIDWAVERDKK